MKFESLLRDVRFGVRMLGKHPLLALTVIVTLGLGIGLTSTAFNITNGIIYKELPFEDPDRILVLRRTAPEQNVQDVGVTIHDLVDWRREQSDFEQLGAFTSLRVNLASPDDTPDGSQPRQPQRHYAALFTSGVFEALRVQPILGRTFRPPTCESPGHPVAIGRWGARSTWMATDLPQVYGPLGNSLDRCLNCSPTLGQVKREELRVFKSTTL
jgi:hypothetical protein